MTVNVIGKWADDILSGAVKPHLKSEEVPESNNGPVFTLVGKQWEQVVMDPTKDVFIFLYAPWCAHCKKLLPIWDELGEQYAKKKNLVIAKFDATANETPGIKLSGYPTIYFFPSDYKEGVKYQGDRDLETFTQYLTDKSKVLREAATGKNSDGATKFEL